MKHRLGRLSMAAVAALVLVGCLPPPPPGWVPPVITATVSPDPVVAGEPFTVEVTAVDPVSVTAVDLEVRPPKRISESDPGCVASEFVPAPTVTRVFECVMPEDAPNGSWHLSASAKNPGSGIYQGTLASTFTVIGGEDDQEPPVMDSVVVSSTPVVIGEPFSVTVRAFDENHLPPSPTRLSAGVMVPAPPAGQVSSWGCAETTPTVVDATVLEWHFTGCLIPTGSSPFNYGAGFNVTDALGYTGRMSVLVQAVTG